MPLPNTMRIKGAFKNCALTRKAQSTNAILMKRGGPTKNKRPPNVLRIKRSALTGTIQPPNQRYIQMFGAPDPEADTTEQSAVTRADTAKYKRRAHKHARYEARYARHRNFQYLALSGEYLRICSCIFHCTERGSNFSSDVTTRVGCVAGNNGYSRSASIPRHSTYSLASVDIRTNPEKGAMSPLFSRTKVYTFHQKEHCNAFGHIYIHQTSNCSSKIITAMRSVHTTYFPCEWGV